VTPWNLMPSPDPFVLSFLLTFIFLVNIKCKSFLLWPFLYVFTLSWGSSCTCKSQYNLFAFLPLIYLVSIWFLDPAKSPT
jgi:hypothetical protein